MQKQELGDDDDRRSQWCENLCDRIIAEPRLVTNICFNEKYSFSLKGHDQ